MDEYRAIFLNAIALQMVATAAAFLLGAFVARRRARRYYLPILGSVQHRCDEAYEALSGRTTWAHRTREFYHLRMRHVLEAIDSGSRKTAERAGHLKFVPGVDGPATIEFDDEPAILPTHTIDLGELYARVLEKEEND